MRSLIFTRKSKRTQQYEKAPVAFAPGLSNSHFFRSGLSGLLDLAVANAGRAGPNTLACTIQHGANSLQVHIPPTIGYVVCVTDFVSKLWALAANFTYSCHKPLVYHRGEAPTHYGDLCHSL